MTNEEKWIITRMLQIYPETVLIEKVSKGKLWDCLIFKQMVRMDNKFYNFPKGTLFRTVEYDYDYEVLHENGKLMVTI